MSKDKGIIAEQKFILRCMEQGLSISRPIGDNDAYDFVTDSGTGLKRVQVKGIFTKDETKDSYQIKSVYGTNKNQLYTKKDIDIFVVLVYDLNSWYLIDVEDLKSTTVRVYPHRDNPRGFYEHGHEQWRVLYE